MKDQHQHKLIEQIKTIEQERTSIISLMTEQYAELKKKLSKNVEKIEKTMHNKINQLCAEAIAPLSKAKDFTELIEADIYQYQRKTDRFIQSLKAIDFKQQLNKISIQIKDTCDRLKKTQLFNQVQMIKDFDNLVKFENTLKLDHEPASCLMVINKKIIKIGNNKLWIDRNCLDKKIDVCLPIKLKSKEKQLLLCLHSQLLAIYNDKLILQCHRQLSYTNIIWEAVQIQNYVFLFDGNRIIRVNLTNMNQILIKNFAHKITTVANAQYGNYLIVSSNTTLIYLNLSCQILYSVAHVLPIQLIRIHGGMVITVSEGQIRCQGGLTLRYRNKKIEGYPLELVPLFDGSFILITKNSYYIFFKGENSEQTLEHESLLGRAAMGACYTDNKICCLGESGRKIHVYSY